MTLYRVVQEGFTNIQKHAQASTVSVNLHFAEEEAHLSIRDNGNGFDTQQLLQPLEGLEKSYGLQGIWERLTLIGGRFHLESQPGSRHPSVGYSDKNVHALTRSPGHTPI